MTLIIIWFPIISFLISSLLGRYLGITGVHILSVFFLGLSLLSYLICSLDILIGTGDQIIYILKDFINLGYITTSWTFLLNSLNQSILLPILLISFCVHFYSVNYMSHDPHQQRFISYLGLFTGSIILLVTSESLLQLFIGWEIIGISSYLLIGFWYTRLSANQASLNAFFINRLGDVSFSIALYFIFANFNCLNIDLLLNLSLESDSFNLLTICVLIAAIAKSAQLGFQTWLPLAIEGPTPVSALIHAATLVTAGAYLLLRLSNILILSNNFIICSGIVGGLTALFAGTVGIIQNDLKRVIAFSTCSQIGYLFLAIGIGNFNGALFHLINHAIFKALLFLSAGIIIHSVNDNQDLRRLGGLLYYLPVAYISLLIGSLSLIALPYLTGYYSKEIILELSFIQFTLHGTLLYWLGVFSASLTGFYSIRLLSIIFYNTANSSQSIYQSIHHYSWKDYFLILPLILLSFLSILLGYYLKEIYIGLGNDFLIDVNYSHNLVEVETNISNLTKIIPLIFTLLGSLLSFYIKPKSNFLSNKWFIDSLYNWINFNLLQISYTISKQIDRGFIETIGPYGFSKNIINYSESNFIFTYYNVTKIALTISLGFLLTGAFNININLIILSLILFISLRSAVLKIKV